MHTLWQRYLQQLAYGRKEAALMYPCIQGPNTSLNKYTAEYSTKFVG